MGHELHESGQTFAGRVPARSHRSSSLASLGSLLHVRACAVALVLAASSLPALAQEGVKRAAPPDRARLESYLKIRAPGSAVLDQQGTLFVRDWPKGVWQIYRVEGDKATPDAKTTALTSFRDGASGFSLSPDASKILVAAATGGDENTRLYLVDPKATQADPKVLLEKPRTMFTLNLWLDDSSGFIYTANDDSPTDFHIYRYSFADGSSTKLVARPGSWGAGDVTPDASRVLVAETKSVSDSRVFEVSPGGTPDQPKLTELSILPTGGGYKPGEGTASNQIVGYMPDFKNVLLLSDAEGGLMRLYLKEIGSSNFTRPIAALDTFEIDEAAINDERTLLAVVTNEDGYGTPHLYRLPSFEPVEMPVMDRGVVTLTSFRGNQIVWNLNNARTPGLSFAWNVPAPGQKPEAPRQISFADDQGIDLKSFPLPELVKYPTFDGLQIPAFVFLPPKSGDQRSRDPMPFVINFHGGPESQHRPTFDAFAQYLVSRGYGVMKPNVRGSTGYGRDFHMLDNYRSRWDSVKDGAAGARWLVNQKLSKPGHIAAYGGSYGGYMAAATIIEGKDVFGASVNIVGIVNMKTFLEQTSGYRRKLREVEYGPLTDPDFLLSVSPITRIDEIQVPMFIAHGLNDPRVPVGEALQIHVRLEQRALDNPKLKPSLLIFPDEGHGFAKLQNRLVFFNLAGDFLDRTIGGH
ncbi:MAG: S9 family peptidase [Planctomycetota bacterium]|nr:S9 family peptidase [Planctomycetota bacterium]